MSLHKFLVSFCLWLAVVHIHGATLKVSESCKDAPDSCPVNSICQAVGCLDKLCVCQNETLASADKTKCLRVVSLGEPCTEVGLTCTKRAECSTDGLCVCKSGFIKSDDGERCREQSFIPGEKYSLLGESCDDVNLFCEDARKQECTSGTCQCKTRQRQVTEIEFFSLPSFKECVPVDFSLGTEVQADDCLDTLCKTKDSVYCLVADFIPSYKIFINAKNCPHISGDCPVGCKYKQPEICKIYGTSNCDRFKSFRDICYIKCDRCGQKP
ncbi:uncharacterized protein LOC121373804 [Gigantopelta aegis]|uniref:uncharacterized protein LOC121373804 n=1 Tax=Gigantopelta aegis TaxID=1735272 RepID=UPI001B889213|nr:uncharacterized protein LOC121373804 [Gigantopelta aegis]